MTESKNGAQDKKRSKWLKILILVLSLVVVLAIIYISQTIAPDRSSLQVQDVIAFDLPHVVLMVLSLLLIVFVLTFFTRMIFHDQRTEFGITSIYSFKAIVFRLLIVLFVGGVLILLDVALVNIYISLAGVTLVWQLNQVFGISSSIPSGTDLLSYAEIRGMLFTGIFAVVLAVPALMSFLILSRYGRKKLVETPKLKLKTYWRIFKWFSSSSFFVATLIFIYLYATGAVSIFSLLSAITVLLVLLHLLVFVLLVVFEILRRIFHVTSSYILMVLPILTIFYVIPVLLWALWDSLVIGVGGDLSKTIYAGSTAPSGSAWDVFVLSLKLNSVALFRIAELDFVLMIGVAAIVIGFAEGFSLYSIVKSISEGKKITRTGKILSEARDSASMVRVTRTFFLMTWFSMLWDKAIESLSFLALDLSLPLDFAVNLPAFITLSLNFSLLIDQQFFLPLTFLVLPALIIINSSFKFLSVSLITQYTKDDYQAFFLFISSTFVLIIIKIYSDIAAISFLQGPYSVLLPLSSFSTSNVLFFSVKVFSNLEAFAFFAGLLTVLFRSIFVRKAGEEAED